MSDDYPKCWRILHLPTNQVTARRYATEQSAADAAAMANTWPYNPNVGVKWIVVSDEPLDDSPQPAPDDQAGDR